MDKDIYYKPVLSDDEHLLESSKTPGRYRGLSRDINNENPDIPEWEAYEIDDEDESSGSDIASYAALAIALVHLADFTIKYIIPFTKERVIPYAKEHILPQIERLYGKEENDQIIMIEDQEDEDPVDTLKEHNWRIIKGNDEDVA